MTTNPDRTQSSRRQWAITLGSTALFAVLIHRSQSPTPGPSTANHVENPHDATSSAAMTPHDAASPANLPPATTWGLLGLILAIFGVVVVVAIVFDFFNRRAGWGTQDEPVVELMFAVPILLSVLAWFFGKGDEEVLKILRRDVLSTAAIACFLLFVVIPLVQNNKDLFDLAAKTTLGLMMSALIMQSCKALIEAITVAARRNNCHLF